MIMSSDKKTNLLTYEHQIKVNQCIVNTGDW